jgi:hypothetical protein
VKGSWLYGLAKFLEGAGLVVVLVGVVMSINLGMKDEGLESMRYESMGLLIGGVLFFMGWMLERGLGTRG